MAIDFSKVTEIVPSKRGKGERPFTDKEIAEIIEVMQNAYDDAPIALTEDIDAPVTKKMFEDWIISKGKQIQVRFLKGKFQENVGVIAM
jgi:hypothetical protein